MDSSSELLRNGDTTTVEIIVESLLEQLASQLKEQMGKKARLVEHKESMALALR